MSNPLNKNSFSQGCEEHSEILLRYLTRLLNGDAEQALDLLQDVFLRAWKARENFKGDCSIKSWLFVIAINLFREKIRRKKIIHFVDEVADVEGNSPCPLHQSIANEVRDRINEEYNNLPHEQQEVFNLIRNYGMSYRETAEELGLNVSTVRMRLHRANKTLMAGLKDVEGVLYE